MPHNSPNPNRSVNPWLTLIGVNEDGMVGLSERAKTAIVAAEHVFGGQRHIELVAALIQGQAHVWRTPLAESLSEIHDLKGKRVVVLASGDPFYYGIGSVLTRSISIEEMVVFPAPSSISMACALLGWAQQEVNVVSLCGRPLENLSPHLVNDNRLIILTSGNECPAKIADYLVKYHCGQSRAYVLEALGGPHQRVRSFIPADYSFDSANMNRLNLVAVEVSCAKLSPVSLVPGRSSDNFVNDGQITREEVRALTLAKLHPQNGQLLWDLGAGSGAVAIEWLLSGLAQSAVAVEINQERLANIKTNADSYNVTGRLQVVEGQLPSIISSLEGSPDAVFIGGGASALLVKQVSRRLKAGGRLVINAVTLETERLLIDCHQQYGGHLTRIGLEHLTPLGSQHGWSAARTITQWYWHKPGSSME